VDEGDAREAVQGRRALTSQSQVKLWLDDVRTSPDDSWTWIKTVDQAIACMNTAQVTEASLDHDLGQDDDGNGLPEGRTSVYWMAENDQWPWKSITIHSANVVGVDYMEGMITRYGPFVREGHTTRFVRSEANFNDDPEH
jgi:hypothetical protein